MLTWQTEFEAKDKTMRLLDYINYAITPETKFTICAVLFAAIFVVYFWEPNKKRGKKPKNNGIMRDVDIDAGEYSKKTDALVDSGANATRSEEHQTLQQLDQYVEVLKRHKIHNLDDV